MGYKGNIKMTEKKTAWTPSAGDETQNSRFRREQEGFFEKYINNRTVLDIGCGKQKIDPLARGWDIAKGDGDATELKGIESESFATIYSSHLLEHIDDPMKALSRWWECLAVGGYLIVAVPDEDLYEQGKWPSIFNPDHRTTWTIHKTKSWSPMSKNLIDLIKNLPGHKVISLRILDTRYDYTQHLSDQGTAERQVEVIVQKTGEPEPWVSTVPVTPVCVCGAQRSLKLLGIYSRGKVLVQCQSCGQQLVWDAVKELQKLGVVKSG